jgi:Domain of unknown function (DUF397)
MKTVKGDLFRGAMTPGRLPGDIRPRMNVELRCHEQRGIPTLEDLPGGSGSGRYWVKSSLSFANGNCVEVADLPDGGVGVRNSRDPDGPVLQFTPDEWTAFLGGVRNGEFDSLGRK